MTCVGEMSLGLTNSLSASGSHMERVGVIHEADRESASHRALAGESLTGSLSGSTIGATYVSVTWLHALAVVNLAMTIDCD